MRAAILRITERKDRRKDNRRRKTLCRACALSCTHAVWAVRHDAAWASTSGRYFWPAPVVSLYNGARRAPDRIVTAGRLRLRVDASTHLPSRSRGKPVASPTKASRRPRVNHTWLCRKASGRGTTFSPLTTSQRRSYSTALQTSTGIASSHCARTHD